MNGGMEDEENKQRWVNVNGDKDLVPIKYRWLCYGT